MGPELAIFPLAFVGACGLLLALAFIVRARGRSWLVLPLLTGIAFASWGAQGAASWQHTISIFFMAGGVFVIGFGVVWLVGMLVLRPFEPHISKFVKKLRT